jgi:hypothetical protein
MDLTHISFGDSVGSTVDVDPPSPKKLVDINACLPARAHGELCRDVLYAPRPHLPALLT